MNLDSNPNPEQLSLARFVSACNQTGINLLLELARADGGSSNPLVSPLSFMIALSMLYEGAGEKTRGEMNEAWGLTARTPFEISGLAHMLLGSLGRPSPDGVSVAVADALWVDRALSLNPRFAQTLRQFYGAESRSLDFSAPAAAVAAVNEWTREKTAGHIPSILESTSLSGATDCLLTCAAYFEGKWLLPFASASTRSGTFHLPDATTRQVPMMRQIARLDFLQQPGFVGVRMPYVGGGFAMYLFLPAPESTLKEFLVSVSARSLGEWVAGFAESLIDLSLPRSEQSFSADLKEALTLMKLGTLFTSDADFTPMGLGGGHYVEQIKHHALVKVNEAGTVATAATAVLIGRSLQEPRVTEFNRPFFWMIRDEHTEALLFAGCLRCPPP